MTNSDLCSNPDLFANLFHACDGGPGQWFLEGLICAHGGIQDVVATVISTPLPHPHLSLHTTILQNTVKSILLSLLIKSYSDIDSKRENGVGNNNKGQFRLNEQKIFKQNEIKQKKSLSYYRRLRAPCYVHNPMHFG